MGCPPTDRNALTGELTPPGIRACAALNNSCERVVLRVGAVTGAEANGPMQTVPHPAPRMARIAGTVSEDRV